MKKVLFPALLAISTTFSTKTMEKFYNDTSCTTEFLKYECFKGDTNACSTFINRNSKLSAAKDNLDVKKWLEEEFLGINLAILYNECMASEEKPEKGENKCEEFIKQVERKKVYDQLKAIGSIVNK